MYLHWPSTNASRPAIFDSSFRNVVCQKIATSQVIHKFHIFTHLVYNVSGTDSNLPELYTQVPQSDAKMLSAVTWHLRCFTLLRIHSLVLLLIRDFKQLASATLDGKVILRAIIHASFVNFEVANQWSKTRLQWRDLATRNDMIKWRIMDPFFWWSCEIVRSQTEIQSEIMFFAFDKHTNKI